MQIQPQPMNIGDTFESTCSKTLPRAVALKIPTSHLDEAALAVPPMRVANATTDVEKDETSHQEAPSASEALPAPHPHPPAVRQDPQQQDVDYFRSSDARCASRSLFGEPPSRLQLDQLFSREQLKSQTHFKRKWNFDVVDERPVSGRWRYNSV